MKWVSLIGLLICGSVNAQSVICERYGALPGEPQQTFISLLIDQLNLLHQLLRNEDYRLHLLNNRRCHHLCYTKLSHLESRQPS